jgi:hypothetical protein
MDGKSSPRQGKKAKSEKSQILESVHMSVRQIIELTAFIS